MTLPKSSYRDPLDVLLQAEEKSCKGCYWRKMIEGTLQCTDLRRAEPFPKKRCDGYEERGN